MDRYEVVRKIGEGAFGEVLQAYDFQNNRFVALKKVRLRDLSLGIPTAAFREIHCLQRLKHRNVVPLFEVIASGSSVVLVLEFMRSDLSKVLRDLVHPLSNEDIKGYMRMITQGVSHLHANAIMHRDIKPANILIGAHGQIKIGDFGLARVQSNTNPSYTHEVATRWYRAPELLFGARHYNEKVDIWSVGTIFAEMIRLSPLFCGENDIDQLFKVIQVLGTPDPSTNWPGVDSLPDYDKISFPFSAGVPLSRLLPGGSIGALQLIEKMLVYSPSARISADSALSDDYFFTSPLPKDLCVVEPPLTNKHCSVKKRKVSLEDTHPIRLGSASKQAMDITSDHIDHLFLMMDETRCM